MSLQDPESCSRPGQPDQKSGCQVRHHDLGNRLRPECFEVIGWQADQCINWQRWWQDRERLPVEKQIAKCIEGPTQARWISDSQQIEIGLGSGVSRDNFRADLQLEVRDHHDLEPCGEKWK